MRRRLAGEAEGARHLVAPGPGGVDQTGEGDPPLGRLGGECGGGGRPEGGAAREAEETAAGHEPYPARGQELFLQRGQHRAGLHHRRVTGEEGLPHRARLGLQLGELALVQPGHPRAVGGGAAVQLLQRRQLALGARHHHLAGRAQGQPPLLAVGAHEPVAGQAAARLQRVGGVVDAGVEHAAVAARGVPSERRLLLQQHDAFAPLRRQLAGEGEADDSAPHDEDLGVDG